MRERILAELKAKFEGVSEAILGRIADKLAKTATKEEQVKPAVDGVTTQQLLESYGDSRATEAQQTAVANYEKKHNLKDGVKVEPEVVDPPKPQPTGGAGDVPEWAKQLIASTNAVTDRLNKIENQRTTDTRKQQLNAIIDKLPENLRKGYQRISVDDLSDEDFSTLIADVTSEVEGIETDLKSKGAVFQRPNGGQQTNNEQLSEAEIKAINARGAASSEEQPF